MRKRELLVATLTTILAIAGCQTHPTESTPPCDKSLVAGLSPTPKDDLFDGYIDDAAIIQKFADQVSKAKDKNPAISLSVVERQLARKTCKVALADTATSAMTPDALYDRCKHSVVITGSPYYCSHCKRLHLQTGSGFFISADGTFITNYHVVNIQKKSMWIMDYHGQVFPLKEILAADQANDVAICKVDAKGCIPLPISQTHCVGASVWVISHPGERFYTCTAGSISRYHFADKRKLMSITAEFEPGSSGGPVLNNQGHVMGLAAQIQTRTMLAGPNLKPNTKPSQPEKVIIKDCIPAEAILALISDRHGPSAALEPSPPQTQPAR